MRSDLLVALSQLGQRVSRVVWWDHAARDLLAEVPGFGDHLDEGLFGFAGVGGGSPGWVLRLVPDPPGDLGIAIFVTPEELFDLILLPLLLLLADQVVGE